MITFAANSGTNLGPLLISALAIIVLFFVMIVRPQKKNAQKHQALLNAMAIGDQVITTGGIYGTIKSIDEETIELEIAKNTKVIVSKRAIAMKKVIEASDSTLQNEKVDKSETTDDSTNTAGK